MALYDLAPSEFRTPRGQPVTVFLREGTNDHNTAYSALNEDEYGLARQWFSGTVLDVGAHIGTITLALLLDNPDLRVIAVEPIPENLALLRLNAESNGVADRLTIVSGLAGRSGPNLIRYAFKGDVAAVHHAFIGNSSFAVPEGQHQAMRVHEWSLDEITTDPITAVKIDCEGGEFAVWAGCDVSRAPLWFGEWHPNPVDQAAGGKGKTQADVVDALGKTHRVTFTGPEAGPGGFRAELR